MSPLRNHDRLDALAMEIRILRDALLEDERAAFDLADETRIERAALTRARLDAALALYFEESEKARALSCSVHGSGVFMESCHECHETWARRRYGPNGNKARGPKEAA